MKERSLNYEKRFKKYLFSFNWETHKKICENINVVESTEDTRRNKK